MRSGGDANGFLFRRCPELGVFGGGLAALPWALAGSVPLTNTGLSNGSEGSAWASFIGATLAAVSGGVVGGVVGDLRPPCEGGPAALGWAMASRSRDNRRAVQ